VVAYAAHPGYIISKSNLPWSIDKYWHNDTSIHGKEIRRRGLPPLGEIHPIHSLCSWAHRSNQFWHLSNTVLMSVIARSINDWPLDFHYKVSVVLPLLQTSCFSSIILYKWKSSEQNAALIGWFAACRDNRSWDFHCSAKIAETLGLDRCKPEGNNGTRRGPGRYN